MFFHINQLQKNQYLFRGCYMGVLFFLQLFSNAWYVLVYYLPINLSYGYFIGIIFAISLIFLISYFIKDHFVIRKEQFVIIIIDLIIAGLFLLEPSFYGHDVEAYYSYRTVLLIQTIPMSLCAFFVEKDEMVQLKIYRLIPVMGILFSVIAFMACVHPTSSTGAGFAINDYGLDYNSASYLAALASALTEYYFINNDMKNAKNHSIIRTICFICIFLNLFSILIAGGRGGLVAYITCFLVSVVWLIKKANLSINTIIKMVVFIGVVGVAVCFIIRNVVNTTITTSGFARILSTINTGESSGRDAIRKQAIMAFKDKPLLGHGFGSVFFEIGFYSHNIFTDAMIEIGTVGVCLLIVLLFATFVTLVKLIKVDSKNSIWMYIFIYSFTQSLFSGYYLAQIPLWWIIVFGISRRSRLRLGGEG